MAQRYQQQELITIAIPAFHFDPTVNNWVTFVTPNNNPRKGIDNDEDERTLTTLSYNVWFDPFAQQARYGAIMDMCNRMRPDVLCFQEATKPFLQQLEAQEWYRQNYVTSDISHHFGTFATWYGVLIAVKKSEPARLNLVNMYYSALHSGMGRTCLSAQVAIGQKIVDVGTVHLESLDSKNLRKNQLTHICGNVLRVSDTAILMGDFNFDDKKNWSKSDTKLENDIFQDDPQVSQFNDVWSCLRPEEEGKTFDTTVNTMLRHYERMRYDRVIIKSNEWKPASIELVGNKQIGITTDGRFIFPSDHFGLFTSFRY